MLGWLKDDACLFWSYTRAWRTSCTPAVFQGVCKCNHWWQQQAFAGQDRITFSSNSSPPTLRRDLLLPPCLTNDSFLLTFLSRRAFKALQYPQLGRPSLNDPWSVYLRDAVSAYCFLPCWPLQAARLTLFRMVRRHLAELSRASHSI